MSIERQNQIKELLAYRTEHGFPQSQHERDLIRREALPDWSMEVAAAVKEVTDYDENPLDVAEVIVRRMNELGYYMVKTSVGIYRELREP